MWLFKTLVENINNVQDEDLKKEILIVATEAANDNVTNDNIDVRAIVLWLLDEIKKISAENLCCY